MDCTATTTTAMPTTTTTQLNGSDYIIENIVLSWERAEGLLMSTPAEGSSVPVPDNLLAQPELQHIRCHFCVNGPNVHQPRSKWLVKCRTPRCKGWYCQTHFPMYGLATSDGSRASTDTALLTAVKEGVTEPFICRGCAGTCCCSPSNELCKDATEKACATFGQKSHKCEKVRHRVYNTTKRKQNKSKAKGSATSAGSRASATPTVGSDTRSALLQVAELASRELASATGDTPMTDAEPTSGGDGSVSAQTTTTTAAATTTRGRGKAKGLASGGKGGKTGTTKRAKATKAKSRAATGRKANSKSQIALLSAAAAAAEQELERERSASLSPSPTKHTTGVSVGGSSPGVSVPRGPSPPTPLIALSQAASASQMVPCTPSPSPPSPIPETVDEAAAAYGIISLKRASASPTAKPTSPPGQLVSSAAPSTLSAITVHAPGATGAVKPAATTSLCVDVGGGTAGDTVMTDASTTSVSVSGVSGVSGVGGRESGSVVPQLNGPALTAAHSALSTLISEASRRSTAPAATASS